MEDEITHIWEHALGVFYPGDLDIELIVIPSPALLVEEQTGGIGIEIEKEGDSFIMVFEESAIGLIEFVADNEIEISLTVDGTIIYHPTNTYLPQVKNYLEHPNDLTEIYLGNRKLSESATIYHNHDSIYAPINHTHVGGTADMSAWFELVNEGQANEYLRVKKALAGDFEIQAWTNNGQFPGTIWQNMPLATNSTIGGLILGGGATRFYREDGTWQTITGGVFSWNDLTDKPSTFPPSTHTHLVAWSDVSGKPAIIAISPTPAQNEIAVWNGAITLKGGSGITYDGSTFHIEGNITASGEISAFAAGDPGSDLWDFMPAATTMTLGGIMLGGGSTRFFREDGTWQAITEWTGITMTYPSGSGIALVSGGNSWGDTIINNSANWNTAYDWGDHGSEGYLTTQISHSDVLVDGDFTSNGLMKRTSNGGYSIKTDNSANWNTAYGWGNHGSVGYLTSQISHSDVLVDGNFTSNGLLKRTSIGGYSIVTDNSGNWNTAYGWGNHGSAGYAPLASPSITGDTTFSKNSSTAFGITIKNTSTVFNTTKGTGLYFIGTDTASTPKSTGSIEVFSTDVNYINGVMIFKIRGVDVDPTERMRIDSYGNVIVNGEVEAFNASDERLKYNVAPFTAREIINKLNPVIFQWNDLARAFNPNKDDRRNFGLIAQEVEKILPEFIHSIYKDYKSVDYVQFIPILLQAIKEQQAQINDLRYGKGN